LLLFPKGRPEGFYTIEKHKTSQGLCNFIFKKCTSAIVRYAEEEPAEEKKKMIDQQMV